jgi:excisionase family DNA binding protein
MKKKQNFKKWRKTMDEEKLTLNVSEAAVRLGISKPSLYQAIKKGEVPVLKIGHRLLIPISALERHLATAGSNKA